MRVTPIVACLCVVATAAYELRVIHTNDIHAHLDEFNEGGIDCRQVDVDENTCYGGIARMRTAIDRVREEAARVGQETLLFDAGDQFQGTLFFNVYKSAKITEFMNAFQYDLMCIGNHEFDESEEFLFKFFESLSFPVVSANIDLNTTKFLHRIVKPYVILEKYKLGVIGFITKETQSISMGARGITFLDPVGPVQQAVDELHRQGIRRIIAVSHNGFKEDQYLAAHTHGIALIVGGHSHSLLLNEPNDDAVGRYPTPVVNTLGKTTYVVQAHRYGDYLGNVLVEWDDNDDVVSVEGDPIRLDQSIPKHTQTADDVAGWRLAFDYLTNSEAGKANASFEGDCVPGRSCPMAELVADAMLAERRPAGAQIALINAGGIRAHLSQGGVTCGDVLNVLPFGNTITDITLTGQDIIDIIESNLEGLTLSDPPLPIITSAHWAGVRYSYRSSAPPYRRVVFIDVADVAGSYTRLVPDSKYVVVTDDFIAWGGDNFFVQGRHDVIQLDLVYDVVVRYIQQQETIFPAMDGRVQAVP